MNPSLLGRTQDPAVLVKSPDLAQGFDTKPCLLLPWPPRCEPSCDRAHDLRASLGLLVALAARFGSSSGISRDASRGSLSTAATVFEMDDDRAFFERHRMTGRNGLVIPAGGGGVDVEGFRRALAESPPVEQLRRELGLGTSPVVITVTRMTRHKGIPTVLMAAAMVHQVRPDVKFLLVGAS
jgi:hypothetical protein